jgi:hypothetical protein
MSVRVSRTGKILYVSCKELRAWRGAKCTLLLAACLLRFERERDRRRRRRRRVSSRRRRRRVSWRLLL